jgi:hypothetical protein
MDPPLAPVRITRSGAPSPVEVTDRNIRDKFTSNAVAQWGLEGAVAIAEQYLRFTTEVGKGEIQMTVAVEICGYGTSEVVCDWQGEDLGIGLEGPVAVPEIQEQMGRCRCWKVGVGVTHQVEVAIPIPVTGDHRRIHVA